MECGCSGEVQMAYYTDIYLRAGDFAEFVRDACNSCNRAATELQHLARVRHELGDM